MNLKKFQHGSQPKDFPFYFDKSNFLTISHKKNTDSTIDIKIVNVYDKEKDCIIYLGVFIDISKLNWKQHPR